RGLAEAAVVDNMDEPVQMQLTQGGYLVGRVEDLAGKPLGGVGVQALIVTGGGDAEDCLRANSSDGGEFRLGPLPAGRPLRVSSYQAYLMAVDWPWADLGNVILGPGDELELPVLVLKPEGESIEGRVLGPDGAPVAGAAVAASESVSGDAPHTTTDTDGRFRLTRLRTRGDVWLLAFLPERDLYAAVQVAADVAFAPDIVLAPLGKANGSIFKAGGEALANTKIMVWPPGLQAFGLADLGLPRNITKMGPEAQTVETDADGGWEVEDLVAGMEYEIAVAAPDHPHAFRRISSFEAAGGEVVEVGDTFLDQ
ncbi:MAG: carboxypeptidase regulatory-like domain-containing protein, partial [Armatimonadota bacterium]